jgi:hypothetical protein
LVDQIGIDVLAEHACARPVDGGFEQSHVAHVDPLGELVVLRPQQVVLAPPTICCMLRPSVAARARRAAVCSSLKRKVMAMPRVIVPI